MKTIKALFLIFSIPVLLIACSSEKHGTIDASTEEVQEMLDTGQTGFVLIIDEKESQLLRNAEKALLEKEQTALQFDVFRNDASNENTDGLSNNPFRHMMPYVNTIYYIEKGNVVTEFSLETSQQKHKKELEEFIEIVGDSHE